MRPQGDIRIIFAQTAASMVEPGNGVTWRAVAEQAQIGYEVARNTMKELVRSGEWERIGSEKDAGSTHWHGLYAPVPDQVRMLRKVVSEWTEGSALIDEFVDLAAASK